MFAALKSIFSAPRTQGNLDATPDEMVDIVIDERLVSKKPEAKGAVLSPWAQGPSTPAEMAQAVIASSMSSFDVDKVIVKSTSTDLAVQPPATPAIPKASRKPATKSNASVAKGSTSKVKASPSKPRAKRGLNTVGFPKGDWILPGSSGAPEVCVNFQAEYSEQRPETASN